MEDVHRHSGLKLRQKVAGLWFTIVRSRHSRLKAEDDISGGSNFCPGLSAFESNATPNPNLKFNSGICSSIHNCFSFRMPYRHASGRLCRHLSFTETKKERLKQVKGKIKGWVQNNRNGNEKSRKELPKDVPKGFVAVFVGDEEEEQTRFVIPVRYFNHPLFLRLLNEAEAVYGFNQKGVFTIPCQISDFEYLQWLIEREHNYNKP